MKVRKWTMALAGVGLVSLPAVVMAEEKANQLLTGLTSTTLSGYVNTSIHWNTGSGNGFTPPVAYNGSGKQDGFNLNAIKLAIEKPLDEAQWAAGYKAELIFGDDARDYLTTLDDDGDSSPATIKQAYVALRAPVGNGLDFKLGVFDTIIGYEVFDGGSNPNYTRSYGFTIEPTTHTGLLASYQICKAASVSFGIANTHGPAINEKAHTVNGTGVDTFSESYKTYMGSVTLTAPEDFGSLAGSTVYMGFVSGLSSSWAGHQNSWYAGGTFNATTALKVGVSFDYQDTEFLPGVSYYANSFAVYSSFQATEKLSLHARGEYTSTDAGYYGADPLGGNAEIVALTGTLQYDLWKNVLSRLEIRWDHLAGDGDQTAFGGTPPSPGGPLGTPGDKRNAVLIAANVIYKF